MRQTKVATGKNKHTTTDTNLLPIHRGRDKASTEISLTVPAKATVVKLYADKRYSKIN
jgi:hypothetical protein